MVGDAESIEQADSRCVDTISVGVVEILCRSTALTEPREFLLRTTPYEDQQP
jgi:hypothetical protein